MPALLNPRHERFAQELAKGKTADEAYISAGFNEHRGNAARLRANEDIQGRLKELLERGAKRAEITKERLTEMYLSDREKARELGQMAAAIRATDSLGKLHGMLIERSEHTGKDGSPLLSEIIDRPPRETREEWEARRARELTAGAAARTAH